MEKLTDLTLPLKSLPIGNQVINVHLDGGFFGDTEPCEVRSASVDVVIKVEHSMDDIFVLDMAIGGEMTIPCDRCLDDMTHFVDTDYHLTVKLGDKVDDSRDNVLEVPALWKSLDLAPIVRDTVMLTIPISHCHADRRDCNAEVTEWLRQHEAREVAPDETPAGDDGNAADPRWEALRNLMTDD